MEKWRSYQSDMWKIAISETSKIYGGIVNATIAQVMFIIPAVIVLWLFNEQAKLFSQLTAAILALLPIVGMIVVQRIAAPINTYHKNKKRLELINYDDVEIELFQSPETIEEKRNRLGLGRGSSTKKIELLVRNMGVSTSLLSSTVTMEELHWEHPEYKQPYDGVETKPFLWADYNSSDGKRNIPPTGKGHLIVATQHADVTAHFRFNFYDGESNVFRTLPGKYTIKIRVDGQAKKGSDIEDLSPVLFDLSFVFDGNFSDVTIKKLPRPAT